MKKIFIYTILLVIILSGCESNGPKGNVRFNTDDLLPDYTLTTMPPHSYSEFSGTYLESFISSGEAYYSSLYESMYPTETEKWGGMKAVTGISAQRVEAVTTPPDNDFFSDISVCVRNPSDEEFEQLLSDVNVSAEDMTDETVTTSESDGYTEKTKMSAVTADTAAARYTTVSTDAE